MAWPKLSLRTRRQQVRDFIAAHLPGADATVPNSRIRAMAEAQASLTHDNDLHLDWVARMMMPDTAEDEFVERWANIWLPQGRKGAAYARGQITITGSAGAVVPSGTELTAPAYNADGDPVTLQFEVTAGVTLATTSIVANVAALSPGVLANLDEGAELQFVDALDGIDGTATVAAPGLAGGAEQETDVALIARYIDRIQEPPHGGSAHDYVQWMLEVPGVTRAWAQRDMGVGTITCRFMMDDVRASYGGIPQTEDLALVAAYIDGVRPVTVADRYVVAPIAQPLNFTVGQLVGDTPETRANIATEIREMLRSRAAPGSRIYASWIREAVSAATGEDHHELTISDVVPSTNGHLIVPGTITYA